ncbi:dihydroorotase, partial [Candidatus Woesearchaeota archaeon]|nr:dihydroorotase [Candidatus Woesearchaeota archaeon]
PADLCLFDPEAEWIVDDTTWHSRGLNTPYRGQTLKGRVRLTLIDGEPVYP